MTGSSPSPSHFPPTVYTGSTPLIAGCVSDSIHIKGVTCNTAKDCRWNTVFLEHFFAEAPYFAIKTLKLRVSRSPRWHSQVGFRTDAKSRCIFVASADLCDPGDIRQRRIYPACSKKVKSWETIKTFFLNLKYLRKIKIIARDGCIYKSVHVCYVGLHSKICVVIVTANLLVQPNSHSYLVAS